MNVYIFHSSGLFSGLISINQVPACSWLAIFCMKTSGLFMNLSVLALFWTYGSLLLMLVRTSGRLTNHLFEKRVSVDKTVLATNLVIALTLLSFRVLMP